MSSMSRIVDTLTVHEKGVFFLMWNPDGMQLATAGDDETLNIWNFFSCNPKQNKNIRKNKFSQPSNRLKYEKFSTIDSLLQSRWLLLYNGSLYLHWLQRQMCAYISMLLLLFFY